MVDQILLITASIALIGLTVLWIIRPLLRGEEAAVERTPETRALAELSAQHETILRSLQDLDGDYAAGKLTPDDFQTQRNLVLAQGVGVLQRLDAVKGHLETSDPDLDAEIEEAVKARRTVTEPAPRLVCSACGAQVRAGARFCDQCGAAIRATL